MNLTGKLSLLIIIILVVQLLFGLMVSLKNKSLMMKKIYYSIFITNSFYDFYDSLTKHTKCPPLKIILCCSGGLSSSFFANKLAELISLKHLNYEIIPLGFYQLNSSYLDCDAIYLAPQISYLEPQAMNIVKNTVPVHCVTPSVYATYNYRGLLDMITNENISKTKENGTI